MSESTDHLDKLLGFTKPIDQMTDDELIKALRPHLAATRPLGDSLDDLMNDPIFKNAPGLADLIKEQKSAASNFKLRAS